MRLPDTNDDSSKWKTFDLFWGLHSQQPDFQAGEQIADKIDQVMFMIMGVFTVLNLQ